ncbi:hydrolase or acyltransferase (alpha beta hydrolase superfamily) [Fusarium tjaetaba]|uniref:Hydrolase or acyltransferase (Alpha beta hydrolase superfamily) n=1 Tax=Fusarium tjaetaba TaxID=1567544 RepID=A0A8H5VY37_9HYPO|nr:hydrolase or acyltransferase (alpha beta hydrolase superfamily) [Fusarium tjaetaba]KAF5638735.1 hydrolase or acyltransferase (alpha beta hydrolase superfamily) [Fusarium tjaetaba]
MLSFPCIVAWGSLLAAVTKAHDTEAYPPNATISNTATSMFQLSNDTEFSFVLSEYLSLANEGGSATGEVLRAAAVIEPNNPESWYREFNFLADKIREQAVAAEKKKDWVSARLAYFRSSSYYRGADFFLHGNQSDPRINILWQKQNASFTKAVDLLPKPPTFVELKATKFTVPAYFYPADAQLPAGKRLSYGKKIPTVIVGTGYDGSQEALYHSNCREIIQRGWNCITYEGPGQATVRRQQNLGFMPEWWETITPVVDYVRSRHDVDPDRVALIGMSFGGLLAPLAATHEHRLAAVLAIDGMLNLQRSILEQFPPALTKLFLSGNSTAFDDEIYSILKNPKIPTALSWPINQGMWAWNTKSPFKWLTMVGEFNLDKQSLSKIKCPVFVASGQDDTTAPEQPEEMARAFGKQAHYFLFKTELGSGVHCAIGAENQLAQETLGWLEGVFDKVSK